MIYLFIYCMLLSAGQGFHGASAGADGARGADGTGQSLCPLSPSIPSAMCLSPWHLPSNSLWQDILNMMLV